MRGKLLIAAALSASGIFAQTAQTALFRAVMLAANTVPPAAWDASGAADILVHVVRDSSGNILSGSVDFSLSYEFPNDATVTGLGIAGDIAMATDIMAAAGSGHIYQQVQVMAGDQAGLSTLNALLTNPSQYSVSVLTTDNPSGAIAGQLQPANAAVLMAELASSNASGAATVTIYYTGPAYAITSAEVTMQIAYQFPAQVTFSATRIYAGQDQSGALAVAADVIPGTQSVASGAGVQAIPGTQIDMSNPQMVEAVQGILLGPTNYSVDVDTVEYPSAALSGQLRGTDSMTFEIPNTAGPNSASQIVLHTLRLSSGAVLAGTVIFDINYRLAAGAGISELDIDGDISASPIGTVTTDPSGSGNVYAFATVYSGAGLTSLSDIVSDPENHELNIQTTTSPAAITVPLAPPNTSAPVVNAVISIVEDKTLTTFAPGELVEIYGTNLAKVTTDLSGWPGGSLPDLLNGVAVAVGSQRGRLLYVSPTQVDAELAFETQAGAQFLSVNNGNAPSAPISMNVAAVAPALYDFVFKNADFSLVGASNPAHAGDVLVLYATGMGQTTPMLATGQSIPLGPPFFDTAPVTVTMGGQNANVIYSIAAPPYVAGLYQMAVTTPAGLGAGSVPVVASVGGVASNTVTIPVQ